MRGGVIDLPEYKEYRLFKMFGWTPDQLEGVPALKVDYYLAIDDEVNRLQRPR